ncbi:MAG: RnfABCDGE type electron transport complex subunit D [Solobacterium sp.]|nr:RnfABCDGE type electron transport complex subunit D [Solobacterium sp.]
MKFSYKPSPNYRTEQTTTGIMLDLTACLGAVTVFAAVYYGMKFGASNGLRVILMMAAAVITAFVSEAVYFKVTGSKDIKYDVTHSYGWVTAMILVLITRLDVSIYAVVIATFICIIFGKLVFGGFGQNIFNPAAFGEAIIMTSFAASKAAQVTADVFTGATPVAEYASNGWIITGAEKAAGISNLILGNYPSVIGGSCALLLLLCGAFMIYRKDIDWHLSIFYLLYILVFSLIAGFFTGNALQFALVNLLSGGVIFGAVFMMTDPVTTPITIPGRMIFAAACAALTLIIRWKANLPDGVLFSILLMNMLTPAIDKMVNGNQIKDAVKIRNKVLISTAICALITIGVGALLKPAEASAEEAAPAAETAAEPAEKPAAEGGLGAMDFSANEASCTEQGDGVYACKALGYAGQSGGDANEALITVKDGKVVSVEMTTVSDTAGISDSAVSESALAAYAGADLSSDIETGATASFTEGSIKAMVQAALKAAGE